MNYRQWIAALNPAFRNAYYDSPLFRGVAPMDDLAMYLMM